MGSHFKVETLGMQSGEVLLYGWEKSQRIVARIPTHDLTRHLCRELTPLERDGRVLRVGLEGIERAIARKLSRGEFHRDRLSDGNIACVHIEIDDLTPPVPERPQIHSGAA